jgi:hypothetical protein
LAALPIMFTLLPAIKSTHCPANVARELKKASSAWVHDEIGDRTFSCQDGYAAFTVSATVRVAVRKYICNQEEHHRFKSFREEFAGVGARVNPRPNLEPNRVSSSLSR